MKRLFYLFALAAVALPAFAQDVTGTWQGALAVGPQTLRTVLKISREADRLSAVFYSIDQGGQPLQANAASQNGSSIKLTFAAINGSYEGKLGTDSNSILGTWSQGSPLPLNLTRATVETAWTIPEPPPPPKLMSADAKPAFEVATIKQARPDERFSLLVNRSGMLNTTNTSVNDLIKFAYDLHPRQITGGPSWMDSEKFDISAKPDTPGLPNGKQLKAMVKGLLEERFQLKFHLDKKELPVYAITVTKTGHKLTKNENNPNGLPGFGGGGPRGLNVRNATMAEFAAMLQANVVEQPVVDQTELGASRYDFIVKWTPDQAQRPAGATPPADDPDAPPDLFTAFQQQLGLRLQSTKAPVDVLVVDKVEKPTAN